MAEKSATKKSTNKPVSVDIKEITDGLLKTIDKDREREIISRRFGLFERRETLEQIGELLGITRERVRQLEKTVLTRLRIQAEQDEIEQLKVAKQDLLNAVEGLGKAARIERLTSQFIDPNDRLDQSKTAFVAEMTPGLVVIPASDDFYQSVALESAHDEKALKKQVEKITKAIKNIGQPAPISKIATEAGIKDEKHAESLASTSKNLASLNGKWGLAKWPTVNPKNIRDKIYVILQEKKKPMHFSEIGETIKDSDFKRRDVTTQAIHNELIKDDRFVLIGRGIYALREWGYSQGTVADVISEVMKKAGKPLHRDEIVKEVLKSRQVRETTVLLNLQGKPQFKRVAKATYTLAEK
jgi:hypothetical protein